MVLLLPPFLNWGKNHLILHTKNVFTKCTATDLMETNIVIDTVVAMFSKYATTPFSVKPVTINCVNNG